MALKGKITRATRSLHDLNMNRDGIDRHQSEVDDEFENKAVTVNEGSDWPDDVFPALSSLVSLLLFGSIGLIFNLYHKLIT